MRYRGIAKITFKNGDTKFFENINFGKYDEAKKKFIIELYGKYFRKDLVCAKINSFSKDTKEKPVKEFVEECFKSLNYDELHKAFFDYTPNYDDDRLWDCFEDYKAGKFDLSYIDSLLDSLDYEFVCHYFPDEDLDEQYEKAINDKNFPLVDSSLEGKASDEPER